MPWSARLPRQPFARGAAHRDLEEYGGNAARAAVYRPVPDQLRSKHVHGARVSRAIGQHHVQGAAA